MTKECQVKLTREELKALQQGKIVVHEKNVGHGNFLLNIRLEGEQVDAMQCVTEKKKRSAHAELLYERNTTNGGE